MNNIKAIRAFLLVFIVSLLLLAIYYVRMKQNEMQKMGIRVEKVESGIENFHLVEQTENRVNWELWAEKAEITNHEQSSNLVKPHIRVYLDQVGNPVDILSDKGSLDSVTKQIDLTENVVATSGDIVIHADTIHWDSKTETLETDGPVHVVGKDFKVEGVGMKAYVTKDMVELLDQVQGEIILENLPGAKE